MTAQPYVTTPAPTASRGRLGILRCALTGVVVLAATYVACWLPAATGLIGGSHMYISLFTIAPVGSIAALAVGLCWSVALGAITGALVAVAYNAFAFVERG